jgi:hypothetical protein
VFNVRVEAQRSEISAIQAGFVEPRTWVPALEQQRVIGGIGGDDEPIEDEAEYERV